MDLIPGLGQSPGEGNGNPFQYSCLENPMDREACGGYSSWGRIESDVTEYAGTTALSLWMGNGGVGGAVINTSMVQNIFLSLDPQCHSNKSPFPWSHLELGSSHLWFRLGFCSFPIITPSQTQTETPICFRTIKSDNVYSLLRIEPCRSSDTVPQHPWVGWPYLGVCVWSGPEWFL